jgi:hypothetical protein
VLRLKSGLGTRARRSTSAISRVKSDFRPSGRTTHGKRHQSCRCLEHPIDGLRGRRLVREFKHALVSVATSACVRQIRVSHFGRRSRLAFDCTLTIYASCAHRLHIISSLLTFPERITCKLSLFVRCCALFVVHKSHCVIGGVSQNDLGSSSGRLHTVRYVCHPVDVCRAIGCCSLTWYVPSVAAHTETQRGTATLVSTRISPNTLAFEL